MTVENSNIRRRVNAALRDVLPDSVDVKIAEERDETSDLSEFNVKIGGRGLRVMWVRNAWLGTIEKIVARGEPPDVLIAERIPPASRQALIQAGIGWVEASGAAEIAIDSLVVSRTERTERVDIRPKGRWTPAAVGVAEAILAGIEPTVSAVHDAADISVGACIKSLRMLTDIGLLQADTARGPHSGRRVVDNEALLDAYVAAAYDLKSPPGLNVAVAWRDPIEGLLRTGSRWDAAGIDWAASGLAAAAVVAPLVSSVGVTDVYIDARSVSELASAARKAGLRSVEGGRLRLHPFPRFTTRKMATIVNDLPVVPWPRIVVDLRRSGVRGEEAAEHLVETIRRG